ncbi:asparaginase domain-containing protein [Aquimarina sp. AU474]|uniref:asparaginase domain-containing protein n=1 Tax=Aquimarina sp. AU474 TaxID=2108529 RepID=UPI000D69AC63|nr:asparaginase domain-containing protein [Aquimarina sp. AU474]
MGLQIFTTGGTIEGLDYNETNQASHSNSITIKEFLDASEIHFKYSLDSLFRKDSRFITNDDRSLIVEKIKVSPYKRILITHGTYTMAETAIYLGKLNLDKTIVLTGAFVLGTKKNTDALKNLEYAISHLKLLTKGVYIVMDGVIFNWHNVRKNLEKNRFEVLHK